MALTVVTFQGETLADAVNAGNAALLSLLTARILGVWFIAGNATRIGGKEFHIIVTYDTTGVLMTDPFQFYGIEGKSDNAVDTAIQTYFTTNPGQFLSAVSGTYIDNERSTTRYSRLIVTNVDQTNGQSNYAVGGGAVTYTNLDPTPTTVGGIPAGSTFTAQTMQQMWDALLYAYQSPAFSSFQISGQSNPLEVGDTIPASVTFTWGTTNSGNVQANSIAIVDVTGSTTLASGLANDGTEAILRGSATTLVAAGSYTFRIDGTNTHAATFSRNATYTWLWRSHWGFNTAVTLSGAQILALASSGLASAIAGTYAVGATGYKYICVADAIGGQINTIKDQATNFNVPMATVADDPAYSNVDGGGFSYALVSVTNTFGITTNYRVYRTFNILGAAITLVVT